MKKTFVTTSIKVVLLIVATIATFGTSARAQSLDYGFRVNIPFDFVVGSKTLPAGQYSVARALPGSGDLVLQIGSVNGHSRAVPLTIPVNSLNSRDRASLVFHRFDDQYFLYQVWPSAGNYGREIAKSRTERQAEKRIRESVGALMKPDSVGTVVVLADLQ
ncbi:MAG TPA: hypothetical protein VJ372_01625 [Pyrinomonadaceae bacterium]|jgi:hypothetical protein|nr:hypothetical protein [Pyrinomonadaceae bacterium]